MTIAAAFRVVPVALLALLAVASPVAAANGSLELKRVVLSTGGVGYFEYEAEVDGTGALTLDLDRNQVDDVLKSIVVFDSAGHVGSASLPGEEPLAQYFRNLPFGPEALGSPITLLQALQGARIRVTGQRAVEGRLLQVVPEQIVLPEGGVVTRHRLSIMTAEGMAQAVFEESEAIAFLDADLQAQVDGALGAVADNRIRDQRTVTLDVQGEGRRTVVVGYVIGAPLWKASYRATLPEPGAETGQLLGWAHLENLSGQDWQGVDLTLVSGNPVTFRQAIYRAYLVDRPEVPVEVLGRILPRLDQGAVEIEADALGGDGAEGSQMNELLKAQVAAESFAVSSADMAAAPAPMGEAVMERRANLFDVSQIQAGTEAATQVLFHIPDPVTLARGKSLMVPIIAQAVPMQRVAVYQPTTHPRHPVASLRVVNDGAAGLAPGVMTLYERGADGRVDFVGDARLATLSAGDDRLVGYALDQKTLIDMEPGYNQTIGTAKIRDGILEVMVVDHQITTYRIKTLPNEGRSIVIEHPRQPGWTLVEPAGLEATATATDYRIPVDAKAASETTLEVVLELTQWQQFSLIDISVDELVFYAESGALDDAVRDALGGLIALRRDIAIKQAQIGDLDLKRQRLFEDQARIRDNLYEVPQGSDLEAQYLDTLTTQEATLVAIEAERATIAAELAAIERDLADRIGKLDL